MATSSLSVEIDRQADAGYIRVLAGNVNRTRAVTDEVNVDLDSQGRTVGIEVLALSAAVPFDRLIEEFGVPSEAEVAWWNGRDSRLLTGSFCRPCSTAPGTSEEVCNGSSSVKGDRPSGVLKTQADAQFGCRRERRMCATT